MTNIFIQKILKFQKNKEVVNIKELADFLNIKVHVKKTEPTCMGYIYVKYHKREDSEDKKHNIVINEILNERDSNTILAILISELILKSDKLINEEKIEFDIFDFKDIRRNKFSKTIQLATRLAIPEKVLFEFEDLKYDREQYANLSKLNFDFINSAIKDNSLEFLIFNNMIWKTNPIFS
jgi:hypothetical protein